MFPSIITKPTKKERNTRSVIRDVSVTNYFTSFPDEDILRSGFQDAYVINQPMDAVGGDGYWFCQKGEHLTYLVAFDCMGHGRFASMMSRRYLQVLRSVFSQSSYHCPSDILLAIHQEIKKEFGDNENSQLGTCADMGIMCYDKRNDELRFSGARMGLLLISGDRPERIRGHKRCVGGYYDLPRTYTDHTIKAASNSKYYLFSDGVTDLIGGARNKKLGINQLIVMLEECSTLPMKAERCTIYKQLQSWAAANDPLDDYLLIGIQP